MSSSPRSEAGGSAGASGQFAKVLTYRDLVIYGLVYIAPIAPWGTFAYVYDLSAGAAVLAYLIGVVCMYFTANSYKEISGEVDGPGSVYAYARKAMGTGAGFLAGWMVLLDYLMIPALMYVLAAVALGTFLPGVPRWVWAVGFAAFGLAINWFGIAMTARANKLFLLIQLLAVAVFIVWALIANHAPLAQALPVSALWNSSVSVGGIFAATSICILAFIGFDAITTLTEEVRPEQRHLVGKSVVVVLLIIGAIAIAQAWVLAGLSQGYKFTDLASGVYDVTGAKVAPSAGLAMAWIASLVTGIALTPPMLAAVARVLHAMATDGQLPRALSVLHPRYAVPQRTLLLSTVVSLAVALAFLNAPDQLTGIVNFGALVAYAAVHLSVIVLLAVKKRSGRWIAHVVVPVLGLAIIIAVISQMTGAALALGLGWFVVGLVYFLLLKAFRRSAIEVQGVVR